MLSLPFKCRFKDTRMYNTHKYLNKNQILVLVALCTLHYTILFHWLKEVFMKILWGLKYLTSACLHLPLLPECPSPPHSPDLEAASSRGFRDSKESKEPSPKMRRRRSVKISSIALEPAQWQNDALHILTSTHDYRSMNEFLMKKVRGQTCTWTHTYPYTHTHTSEFELIPLSLGVYSIILPGTQGSKQPWIQILKVHTATKEPPNLKGSLPPS